MEREDVDHDFIGSVCSLTASPAPWHVTVVVNRMRHDTMPICMETRDDDNHMHSRDVSSEQLRAARGTIRMYCKALWLCYD